MKKYIAAILFCLAGLCAVHAGEPLRVMSFNVLTSYNDEVNNWKARKPNLIADIKSVDPDFLGLQEAFKNQLNYVLQELDGYDFIGVGRDDGAEGGEYCPVLYKKAKFELLDSGTFWLSETPDVPGKKGWDAACNRIVSWGKFRSKETGREILYANTHFDHVSETARRESSKLILDFKEKTAKDIPFLITGDFNSSDTDQAYQTITAGLRDARKTAKTWTGGNCTYQSKKPANDDRFIIDYIFVSDDIQVNTFTIHSDPPQKDPLPSDHYSIDAELEW